MATWATKDKSRKLFITYDLCFISVTCQNVWRRLEDDFRTLIASGFEFPDVVLTLLTEFSDQEGDTGPKPTKRLSPSDSKHPLVQSDASSDRGDGVPASGGAGGTFAGRTYESGSAFAADSTEAEPREVNAVSADGETVGDAIPEVSRVLMARYDRVRIYDLVWAIGGSRAAKTLGIDPHSMSRLCKDIHVPVPTGAYWAKLKAGKGQGQLHRKRRPHSQRAALKRKVQLKPSNSSESGLPVLLSQHCSGRFSSRPLSRRLRRQSCQSLGAPV
jgi:hypothetical protein